MPFHFHFAHLCIQNQLITAFKLFLKMKRTFYTAILTCCVFVVGMAQTTILDFEAPATSTTFQYFGSPLDPTLNTIVANPNATGANTSSMVARFVKPAVAEIWAGAFSNPNPTTPVDLLANGKVTVMVHMDHIGPVRLKLEGSTNGGANWEQEVSNTKVNEWEVLTFDASLPGLVGPNTPAKGSIYARVVIFFDFGTTGTGTDVVSYFDDIKTVPGAAPTTTKILDFEAAATSTDFQYFGSPLDGTKTEIITNPNSSGINTSLKVSKYIKPGVSEIWAGAFSNPNPTTLIDMSGGNQVCVDVHMDHIGNLAVKLEGSTSMEPNWITKVANTKVNQWETLCFDPTVPSIETPNQPAKGSYKTIVVFFDFGTAGTGTDVTSYFDNVVVKGSSGPVARKVDFSVDMNNYQPNFNKVYVSGSFNGWSGDANPLTDTDGDGIWTGSLTMQNGLYEYKISLDNWAADEKFTGTEACTKVDPSGQFVNRLLLVGGDVVVPKFCYNSCYACGEEVKINFKLGMNGTAPSADGVWIAGGGNFDVPGGRYKMNDANGDGIFEITVPRQRGFNSFFVFTNGACPDYSCKEQLAGLPCSFPGNFNDRFIAAVTTDTVFATCFGTCFANAQCVSGTNQPTLDADLFTVKGNPVQNDLALIQFGTDTPSEKQIELTNHVGQVVHRIRLESSSDQYALPIENLPSGMYFVTVRAENRIFTRAIVK